MKIVHKLHKRKRVLSRNLPLPKIL